MDTATVHLTVEQAAQHAGVSTKTVRRMIRRGELVPGRSGQAYVIDLAALTQALAARQERLSMDVQRVPSSAPGLSSLSTPDALRALVQEAVRRELAPLLDRLDRAQADRDHLAEQLRALQAPQEQPQTAQDAQEGTPSPSAAQTASTPSESPQARPGLWTRLRAALHG